MFTNRYKIADMVIEVTSVYESVHDYCRDYLTDEEPELSVAVSQEDIEFERRKTAQEYANEGLPAPDFPDQLLEETAVYRRIAELMPEYDRFVFHGSVIAVDGQCFLFTAKSGTGKSTHTRLWREYFGDRAVMVNDDKPVLRITESGAIAYGTPYNGKHRLGCNMSAPLKAVCILTRGEKNEIVRTDRAEVYPMLLQQVYRPSDPVQMIKTMKLLDRLTENVAMYRLACNMDIEAAETAYNAMR